jgi:hypothetical protein
MSDRTVVSDEEIRRHFRLPKLPPEGFQPLTASERELKVYGFPHRPDARTHPKLAASWERTLARPLRFVTPDLRVYRPFPRRRLRSELLRKPSPAGGPIFNDTSSNWSGASVNQPQSEPLTIVNGAWIVPDVAPPPSASDGSGGWIDGTYLCSVWVGIDGSDGSSDVLQAGTTSQVVVSGGQISSTSFWVWTEWFNLGSSPQSLLVTPGDLIQCAVCAPPQANPGNAGNAFFTNLTSGLATSYQIAPPPNVTLSGNVAEWIVEDPATGAQPGAPLFPFPNYGATFFSNCFADSENEELNLGSATPISLVDTSGNALSVGVIESDSVLMCYFGPYGP